MKTMGYFTAVRDAMFREMEADENVIYMGCDVRYSLFGITEGMIEAFGEQRVLDTPLSENCSVGAAVGAAMTGIRPVVDLNMSPFAYVAMDQLVSMAAKTAYIYGGQFKVPLVINSTMVYRSGNAAQHSDRPYPMFMNVPGFKILTPSCPSDIYGLFRSAIRDDDPVLIFTDSTLGMLQEEVDEECIIPIGKAAIKKEGKDVTIVAISGCVPFAMGAAGELEKEGISVEVIDPRTLVPLDKATILKSVEKTGRLVVVDPAHKTCSAASEIAAIVAQEAFGSLKSAVQIVATEDVHIPFSPALEHQLYPSVEKIFAAVKKTL